MLDQQTQGQIGRSEEIDVRSDMEAEVVDAQDVQSEAKEMPPKYPELADELIALAQAEQDETQSVKLREIIKQIGWPTISKVGAQGSEAAFQIALHADHDHDLQSNCETFLLGRRAFAQGEINEDNIAIIQEVVRKNAGVQRVFPIVFSETLEEVNAGRASINLPPLRSLYPDGMDPEEIK